MDLLNWLTLTGVVLLSTTVLGSLATLIYRSGRSDQERRNSRVVIHGELKNINGHLKKINGTIDEVEELAQKNAVKIATIEGAHRERLP